MSQIWTILNKTTGEVLCPSFHTRSAGVHPKDAGWAWDPETQRATRIDRLPDPAIQTFGSAGWVEDPARVEKEMIARLKERSEREKMDAAQVTPGFAKTEEYASKAKEVVAWEQMQTVVTNLIAFLNLSTVEMRSRFPMAVFEATINGEKQLNGRPDISKAIARFRTGEQREKEEIARLSAIESNAVTRIRAAGTAAAKRQAFADTNWQWSPPTT